MQTSGPCQHADHALPQPWGDTTGHHAPAGDAQIAAPQAQDATRAPLRLKVPRTYVLHDMRRGRAN